MKQTPKINKKLKKSLKYVKEHPPLLDKEHLKELKKLGFKEKKTRRNPK